MIAYKDFQVVHTLLTNNTKRTPLMHYSHQSNFYYRPRTSLPFQHLQHYTRFLLADKWKDTVAVGCLVR